MGTEITREDLKVDDPPKGEVKTGEEPKAPVVEPKESGGDEPPETPSAVEEYVYPDDPSVPEPLRGKKASEAIGVFNTLQTLSQGVVRQLKAVQENANRTREPEKPIFEKDEFVTGEPDKIEEKLTTLFEKKATPFMVDMYTGLSSMAMANAEASLPYFKKYKAEIVAEASQLPVNKTARLETWKEIHDRVATRHVNEIAAELNKPKPPAHPIERGSGKSPTSSGGETELTSDDKSIADGLGLDYTTFKKYKKLYSSAE